MIRLDLRDLPPMQVWDGRHEIRLSELTIAQTRLGVRYDVSPPWPRADDMLPVAIPHISVEDELGTAYGNSCGLYRVTNDDRVDGLITVSPAPPEDAERLVLKLIFEIRHEEYICEFKLDLGPTAD